MNTPEHDNWERLFRQRLSDLEAKPPAGALARILAIANPLPAPVATLPASSARMGAGGIVTVLLGIWLMQATQRPDQHSLLAEPIKINRETIVSTGRRPSEHASLAEAKRERQSKTETAPLTLGSAEHRINKEPLARIQPRSKDSREDVLSAGRKPSAYTSLLAEGKRERQWSHTRTVLPQRFGVTKMILTDSPSAAKKQVLAVQPDDYHSGMTALTAPAINPGTIPSVAPGFSHRLTIDLVETQREVQPYRKFVQMGETLPGAALTAPTIARQRPTRAWFAAVTPLYTYQQIAPVHTDERYVEQVQTLGALSGGRAGWRAQIGGEQAINKQFAIRAGLTVSVLRQSVQYRSRGTSFDSAKVEVLNNQTIRLTPLYRQQTGQLPAVRRFVGISTDIVWRPNAARPNAARPNAARLNAASAGSNKLWQPYLTAGFLAGKYTGAGGKLSGFWQASAGVERAVLSGWWLHVGPSVQYGWHTLTDSPVLTTRPYTYGLSIGLRH